MLITGTFAAILCILIYYCKCFLWSNLRFKKISNGLECKRVMVDDEVMVDIERFQLVDDGYL